MKVILLYSLCFSAIFAKNCPFCDPTIIDTQEVEQNTSFRVLVPHKPIDEVHLLFIPKRHIIRFDELSTTELLDFHSLLKKMHEKCIQIFSCSEYLLLQKNGQSIGQSVPHVHIHYIARKKGFSPYTLIFKFFITPFLPVNFDQMNKIKKGFNTRL